ncbi:hypothetical protein Csa_007107 [Cucumis sativus]|nr:hypothetical protein Csa_007107 [Cucumis sativus]
MGFYGISSTYFPLFIVVVIINCLRNEVVCEEANFDQNYIVTYGQDHFLRSEGGAQVQLSLDLASGTGFKSKIGYGSGHFHIKLKLPSRHSPGVVTTYYLHSSPDKNVGAHDEVDFEFLGTGPVYVLQTNIFANDNGGREQKIRLWFDPSLSFHDYAILWNSHQIVFSIDGIPIRVFKNYTSMGGRYPSSGMHVLGSIWNGEAWASDGKKVDWSQVPFQADYRGFSILGCPSGSDCDSQSFLWNQPNTWQLNPTQEKFYQLIKSKYLYYTYCSNPNASQLYKECQFE